MSNGLSGKITATANAAAIQATAYGIYQNGISSDGLSPSTLTTSGSYTSPLTITGGVSGTITTSATNTATTWYTYESLNISVAPKATAAGINSEGPMSVAGGVSGTITSTAKSGIDGNATAYGLYASGTMNGGNSSTPLGISGTVSATANGLAAAVSSGGALNLNVTGSLSGVDTTGSGQGYAIKSAKADDTVTLGTGATLVGKVDLDGGANTLNLVGTGSASNQFLNTTNLVVGDGATITNWTLNPTAATASSFGGLNVNTKAAATINEYATVTGNIVDNGALTFNVASTLTYGGTISGAGSIAKSGSGSLILTGSNTYSGGTILNDGTVNVASMANLGTGSISFAGGTLLINGVNALETGFAVTSSLGFNTSATGSQTVAGSYSGSGSITKSGSGTLTLTGDSSNYTGTATVASGKLQVASGAALGGTLVVDSGATVGGYGTVDNLTNNGTVSPGGSIGTLNVAGNYTQSAAATYYDEITTGGVGDRLDISGTANLSGGALSVQATQSFYNTGNTWTVITAKGGLTGTFTSVTQNLDSLTLRFVPVYTDNAVLLTAMRIPYSAFAADGRSASVGTGLYRASYTATDGSDMASLLTLLDYSPAAVATSTLQMLSPEPYDAFTQSFFDGSRVLTAAQRAGLHEGGISGSQAFAGPMDTGPATLMAVNDHGGGQASLDSSAKGTAPITDSRFSVFLRPFGMLAHQQARSEQTGYTANTGGLTGGLEFRPVSGLTLALAPAFMTQSVTLKSMGGGNGTVSDWSLALMGAYRQNDWFVDGLFRLGYDTTTATRNIPVSNMNRSARAVWNSWNTTTSLGGGYDFHAGSVTMGPIASVEWSTLSQERYRETRAGGLGLRVNARSDNSLTTTLGGRVFRKFKTSFGAVTPEVRAVWGSQWLNSPRTITASFCGSPDSGFSTKTAGHGYNSAIVDAGVTANLGKSLSATGRVGLELFRPGYDSQAGSVSLKYSF
ncbi:autotransporter domain-containing protein [Desulfovibrio aerotolerans]|uniref:Autotransporter domain-containing protein n=1 Tax=Solidesulfovibrio aerotolerans TaxID=295255 RepID=A0A7C9MNE9_9BACT|nr:autotransporter outer membrane beta-barrel domain-containing protein [Solidesulfovibrio aerotolerans]MYL85333.1 autotransporter domain-containing protein [Solidesulfovibrio aerotolerans]